MATRNQVLSLFGASPEQIMQQEAIRQAEAVQAIRDPYQQVGTAIGVGLGRLFGGKSADVQQAEQMQAAMQGIDPNDPASLRELAQAVASFAPERALQIATYANELEKSRQGEVVNVPTKVGQKPIYKQDAKTLEWTPVGYEDRYENIPHVRTADGLVPLVDIAQYGAKTTTDTDTAQPQAPVPDYITNEQGVVVRNPAKTGEAPATTADRTVTSNVTPEAAERIGMQSGPRGGAEGSITSVAPPPQIQGEITYMNPEVLGEEIAALESQLSAMGRTASGRKELQSRINKLKAQQRKFKKQSSGGQARRNR